MDVSRTLGLTDITFATQSTPEDSDNTVMATAADKGSLQLYRRLLRHILPYRGVFAAAVIAMAVAAAMDASFAALLKEITDRGLVEPDMDFISLIPWLIGGVIRDPVGFRIRG